MVDVKLDGEEVEILMPAIFILIFFSFHSSNLKSLIMGNLIHVQKG